jgi:hypothetical protein
LHEGKELKADIEAAEGKNVEREYQEREGESQSEGDKER